ncbi:hypothetical protein [Marinoscillum luteum]|uniref:HTH cro/C1-type domain-containing protein n=1 Tax=Marinoscillum luteum TaxID=861051 RepID=A0ABW7N6D5_9BACT
MTELYSDFIHKLKKLFGKFDESHKRFEKSSNSEIARELGYSDAQFSRLINESATAGEYQRAIQSIDRILMVVQLESELGRKLGGTRDWKKHPGWLGATVLVVLLLILTIIWRPGSYQELPDSEKSPRDNMLKWTFETAFINPYVKLDDLPEDCNYPCYKYQGKWELKEGYKIPFFRERNGFHYSATEVNMYARCMSEKDPKGKIIEGYEYQKHEIWYDRRELPIDSFIRKDLALKDFYKQLDFSLDNNFVKVATVHTFFRNEFEIDSLVIHRSGKVIGRDLEFTDQEELEELFSSKNLIKDILSELNRIATNRLEDFSRPITCEPAQVPSSNIHLIKDGDEMSFNCQLTTSRLAMNYTKTFVLKDQYIKNTCRVSSN